MAIPFRSITATPKPVEAHLQGEDFDITLQGELKKELGGVVRLTASIAGTADLACDLCAENFVENIDERIKLTITDMPYKHHDKPDEESDYDIIEVLDGMIDLDEIIQSEINSIRLDYHKCPNCK